MRKNKVSAWSMFIGVLLIGLGLYALIQPASALAALAFYLGVTFIVSGVTRLLVFVKDLSSPWLIALGLLDLFVGTIFLSDMNVTIGTLPFIFAFWTLFTGIARITMAYHLYIEGASFWGWEIIAGVAGIIFAFIILMNPVIGSFTLVILMGATLISFGVMDIGEYLIDRKKE